MRRETDDRLYPKLDALPPYKRYAAVIEHGIDVWEYAVYRQARHTVPETKRTTTSREIRLRQFKAQGGNCACCEVSLLDGGQICYDPVCGDVVCRRCIMALLAVRSLMKSGVTIPMLLERLEKQVSDGED